MTGEDLTIQPGLALQQDLALVSILGLTHVERNGHHYVNGMAGLPAGEQENFLSTHADLTRAKPRRCTRAHPRRQARDRLARLRRL